MHSIVQIIMIDKSSPKWNNREEITESESYWGLLQSKQCGKKMFKKTASSGPPLCRVSLNPFVWKTVVFLYQYKYNLKLDVKLIWK